MIAPGGVEIGNIHQFTVGREAVTGNHGGGSFGSSNELVVDHQKPEIFSLEVLSQSPRWKNPSPY